MESGLRLGMDSDVSGPVDGAARLAFLCRDVDEGEGEKFFSFAEELLYTPGVDEVLQAGFFAIGPVAVLREYANHGRGCSDGLIRAEKNATVCG